MDSDEVAFCIRSPPSTEHLSDRMANAFIQFFKNSATKQPPSQQNQPLVGSLEIEESQQGQEMMMSESLEIDESQQGREMMIDKSLEIDQSQQEREMMMEESLEIDESQQGREMMMKESLEIDERQQGQEMMMSVEESSISNYVPPDSKQNDAGDEFMEMDLYKKLICMNVSHETTIEDIIEELKVSEFFMITNNKCYYIYQIKETRTVVLN